MRRNFITIYIEKKRLPDFLFRQPLLQKTIIKLKPLLLRWNNINYNGAVIKAFLRKFVFKR